MKKALYAILVMLPSLGGTACSVKEERGDCPCLLNVHVLVPERDSLPAAFTLAAGRTDGTSYYAGGYIHKEGSRNVSLSVRKGIYYLGACTGSVAGGLDGPLLQLPPGRDAEHLFSGTDSVDCRGEKAADTLLLHKQFCRLKVIFKETGPAWIRHAKIEGHFNGLDLFHNEPVHGSFSCDMTPENPGVFSLCIPRQGDDGLQLSATGDFPGATWPLGEFLASARYNWRKEDLDDAVVTIDLSGIEVSIEIIPWKIIEYNQIEF